MLRMLRMLAVDVLHTGSTVRARCVNSSLLARVVALAIDLARLRRAARLWLWLWGGIVSAKLLTIVVDHQRAPAADMIKR
jgi:hypothetical protein